MELVGIILTALAAAGALATAYYMWQQHKRETMLHAGNIPGFSVTFSVGTDGAVIMRGAVTGQEGKFRLRELRVTGACFAKAEASTDDYGGVAGYHAGPVIGRRLLDLDDTEILYAVVPDPEPASWLAALFSSSFFKISSLVVMTTNHAFAIRSKFRAKLRA